MAFIQRFSSIDRGGIQFIGNTLGLSKNLNTLTAGIQGSIGAFSTLLNTQFSNFPTGTTSDYLQNGSSAILNLPIGSSVLYAELVWGGLYKSQTQDISNLIDNNINLNINNSNYSIQPSITTAQNFLIPSGTFSLGFYVRSADITSIVSSNLNGTYSAQAIPSILIAISSQTNDTNHAGWTLCVVYKNDSLNLRNLTLWVGGAVVGPNNTVTDVTLSGFLTPTVLPITGKAFLSAQEGDAVISGDQFLFGKDVANLSVISGPNNPANNFFASQINNSDGLIETSGTFGTRNANAIAGTNISAGRQGWDITAVDISNKLETSQNSALFRFTSSGDLYVPNALATQIDSLGASLKIEKSVDNNVKFVGENINYSVNITNTGQLTASNLEIEDEIIGDVTFVENSIFVNGVQQIGGFPILIDKIDAGETINVQFAFVANSVPLTNPVLNKIVTSFQFQPFEGFTSFGSQTSNQVSVFIIDSDVNVVKTVDRTFAIKGDEILYTSFIANVGNLKAENLFFKDDIPTGTSFVLDSVFLDGVNLIGENPANGINIGSLDLGQVKEITFKVIVD